MGTKILRRTVGLSLSFFLFLCPPSFPYDCTPHDEPVTPFLLPHIEPKISDVGRVGKNFDITTAELCVFYLLACLDMGKPVDKDFETALKIYCITSNKYAKTNLNYTSLFVNPDLLRHQLEISLAGQRYARFPRLSWNEQKQISLRYPFPELYGRAESILRIPETSPTYPYYAKDLQAISAKPGLEVVLVSTKYRKNDLDFEREDFEAAYTKAFALEAKKIQDRQKAKKIVVTTKPK